jgi:hypothetical protein
MSSHEYCLSCDALLEPERGCAYCHVLCEYGQEGVDTLNEACQFMGLPRFRNLLPISRWRLIDDLLAMEAPQHVRDNYPEIGR